MLVVTLWLLRNKMNYLKFFFYGYVINIVVNSLLKWFIKEPRPVNDWKILQLGITHTKRIGFDKYGMPSGHAQSSLFSTMFIYLSFRKQNLLYAYLLMSLLTMIQRVVYKHHTILQVIMGAIVGCGFGYFVYFLAREKIKGHITEKADDYGPL